MLIWASVLLPVQGIMTEAADLVVPIGSQFNPSQSLDIQFRKAFEQYLETLDEFRFVSGDDLETEDFTKNDLDNLAKPRLDMDEGAAMYNYKASPPLNLALEDTQFTLVAEPTKILGREGILKGLALVDLGLTVVLLWAIWDITKMRSKMNQETESRYIMFRPIRFYEIWMGTYYEKIPFQGSSTCLLYRVESEIPSKIKQSSMTILANILAMMIFAITKTYLYLDK